MRIALIAMSGVRAYNPELTALGLSLPGFVERGKTIALLPSLGLLTLAALTDDRHDVDYFEVDDIAEMDPLPACDLVAFSTYTAQVKECYALSDRFRAAGVTTVIGGLHVTVEPDEALTLADVFALMRDHYEGTEFDMTQGVAAGPYGSYRLVGYVTTYVFEESGPQKPKAQRVKELYDQIGQRLAATPPRTLRRTRTR